MRQDPAPVGLVTNAVVVAVQGINLGAADGMGNTPLMDAIRHGHTEVQAALRAAGASLDSAQVADKLCLAAAENDLATLQVAAQLTTWLLDCHSCCCGFSCG